MYTTTAALLAVTVLAADDPPPAVADSPEGLYVKLSGLAVFQEDSDLRAVGGAPLEAVFEFNAGFGGTLGFGHTWALDSVPVSLSVEVEYAYRTSDIKQLIGSTGTSPAAGQNQTHAFMANALADWDVVGGFGFYVGGGVGGAITSTDLSVDLGGPMLTFPDDEDFSLAWQAMGGVRWALGDRVVLFGGVRFFDAGEVEFDTFGGTNRGLNVELGVRFHF